MSKKEKQTRKMSNNQVKRELEGRSSESILLHIKRLEPEMSDYQMKMAFRIWDEKCRREGMSLNQMTASFMQLAA